MPEHADAAADPLTNTVIPQPHLNCLTCLMHGLLSLLLCIWHSAYMINCNFVLAESETVPWDAVTWYIIWISTKFDSVSTMQREDDEEISAVCYATPALDGLVVPHTPAHPCAAHPPVDVGLPSRWRAAVLARGANPIHVCLSPPREPLPNVQFACKQNSLHRMQRNPPRIANQTIKSAS